MAAAVLLRGARFAPGRFRQSRHDQTSRACGVGSVPGAPRRFLQELFEGTPHFQMAKKDGPWMPVLSCPGAEHVAGGGTNRRSSDLLCSRARSRASDAWSVTARARISAIIGPLRTSVMMSDAWTATVPTMPARSSTCWRSRSRNCAAAVNSHAVTLSRKYTF